MEVGEKIKRYIEENGISQTYISKRRGLQSLNSIWL